MSPLERAARALCQLDGNPENATMDGRPLWQDYLPEARAAISAIREPSETMLKAAEGVDFLSPGENDAAGEWRAMIDKLLEAQP